MLQQSLTTFIGTLCIDLQYMTNIVHPIQISYRYKYLEMNPAHFETLSIKMFQKKSRRSSWCTFRNNVRYAKETINIYSTRGACDNLLSDMNVKTIFKIYCLKTPNVNCYFLYSWDT